MKKLFTLLTMLVIGISGMWAAVTYYQPSSRAGATTLSTSKKYMIYNTAVNSDWGDPRRWFLYANTSSTYGVTRNTNPLSFNTSDPKYVWTLESGSVSGTYKIKNVGNSQYCAGGTALGNSGVDYIIGEFSTCSAKGGMGSACDDGTFKPSANIAPEDKAVYIKAYTGETYWNGTGNGFNTTGKAHVYVLYEVEEVIVPSDCNSYIGKTKTINSDEWRTQGNWALNDSWHSNGPGCANSNMWSPIYLKDITGGTVPTLEGWNFRMTADHSTYEIASVGKIQPECYLTLKNTSVVTMNFGNGHTFSFTVNLDEGTGNILNFNMSNGYNHFNAKTCSNECNGQITVNYGRVSKDTYRLFNASGSGSIKKLILNATLKDPTQFNAVEEIPLVTYKDGVSANDVNTDGIVATGWTPVESREALETQTTSGMYYFLEKSADGVKLYTYNRQTIYYISSGTETLGSIANLSQYTEINVASGAKLNVNQKLNINVSGEGEIDFIADTKEIENASIKGVIITSSGHIAPIGTVTLDGITNNITNDDYGYAFVGSSDVTMNLKGTMDLSSTSIGLSSGSWIIVDGTITLAGLLYPSETVGNNTSLEVKQNSTLTVSTPTSGTSFNIIRNVINAGTINFNGDVKETISADITGTVNIASGKKWILTNDATGKHVWSAIRGSAGEGTLQVPAAREIISANFEGSITVNVKKLVFDGSGDVICCGTHDSNSSFTIPTGKTVQALSATFWNKRSYLNVYGTLESASLKMGHEDNGNYPGTTTIFNGGDLKTGAITYINKATNNEIIVNEGGTLEFSSITKQTNASMKLTATNAILKTAALPATKDGYNYVIAQSGTFSISGTPLTVGETNYGISVADNKAFVKAYNLTVGSTGYATLCLPYNAIIPNGIYAYKAQLAENTVSLTKINKTEGLILPQETGVVINSEPDTYEFIAGYGDAISVSDNSLVGVTEDETLPEGAYILAKSGDKAIFKQATGTLKANKAYLNAGSNSRQQLSIIWTGDDPTGISSIFNTNNPEDGKFFHNGRIVIVKDGIMYNVAGQMMK